MRCLAVRLSLLCIICWCLSQCGCSLFLVLVNNKDRDDTPFVWCSRFDVVVVFCCCVIIILAAEAAAAAAASVVWQ
jgi:hypothetical protein